MFVPQLQSKSDKLLPSVREGLKPKGKQLTALEQQGGVKPSGGFAQPALQVLWEKVMGGPCPVLESSDLRFWPGGLLSASSRILGQLAALSGSLCRRTLHTDSAKGPGWPGPAVLSALSPRN